MTLREAIVKVLREKLPAEFDDKFINGLTEEIMDSLLLVLMAGLNEAESKELARNLKMRIAKDGNLMILKRTEK